VGVPESLKSVIDAFPAAQIAAFADMSSRMILSSATREDVTQERMVALCGQAKAGFDYPLEGLAVEAFGEAYGAILIDAASVRVFLRSEAESTDALLCVCDHGIDLAPFVVKIRSVLDEISSNS
jgi:hypothetical protein